VARLYTEEDIAAALKELRIEPEDGMVNAEEAALIMSWRVKTEKGLEYTYRPDSVRQHVSAGHFKEGTVDANARGSRYPVEQVFRLRLAPRRGKARKKEGKKE